MYLCTQNLSNLIDRINLPGSLRDYTLEVCFPNEHVYDDLRDDCLFTNDDYFVKLGMSLPFPPLSVEILSHLRVSPS